MNDPQTREASDQAGSASDQDKTIPSIPSPGAGEPDPLGVGRAARVVGSLAFLKTADPMPMLRPPDLIDPGECGVVVEVRALGTRAVRFRRGTFLIAASSLSPASPEASDPG